MTLPALRALRSRVILALVLVGWVSPLARTEEPAEQGPPEVLQAPQAAPPDKAKTSEDAGTPAKPNESQANRPSGNGNAGQNQQFDQAVVAAGQTAFERSCTKCHDAARSLERTKDLAGWRTTVRRMAGKRDANIPESEIEPIAVYLASRSAGGGAGRPAPNLQSWLGCLSGGHRVPRDPTSRGVRR